MMRWLRWAVPLVAAAAGFVVGALAEGDARRRTCDECNFCDC